jgi:hypothetical protein
MKRIILAGIVTAALVLWAHQSPEIGGRVPLVFVSLWFGSAVVVSLIFSTESFTLRAPAGQSDVLARRCQWSYKMRMTGTCLLPLALVPLLEMHGVGNDPAVWLIDCALVISFCTVPYFALVARGVIGGVALSMGSLQLLWTCGASAFFVVIQNAEKEKGQVIRGPAFHVFFKPEYRYLFYTLCALVLLAYCPIMLWLGRRRFLRQQGPPG